MLKPTVGIELSLDNVLVRNSFGGLVEVFSARRLRERQDLLVSEFSTLNAGVSGNAWSRGGTKPYRQHSQQGGLASILQPDHCDIHLGRPDR